MSKFVVEQSPPLKGTVKISGSKNSILPIMAACLLTEDNIILSDVPSLSDVSVMQNILQDLGCKTQWDKQSEHMEICSGALGKVVLPYELVSQMRASFVIMGPVLARVGEVQIPLPGGCQIGARPVDLHLKGMVALGASIEQDHGIVTARAKKLTGADIYLDFPSVGATENIMMAASLAEGRTIIQNCAVEPEIVDLSNFLNTLGADIRGAGTDTIKINGVDNLHGTTYGVIPDRIEAGTFMLAAAISKGDIVLENVLIEHLKPVIAKLREANVLVEEHELGLRVYGGGKRYPISVKTMPHPGFPTDMQAQFMAMMATSEGAGVVIETVFENRFMHVPEFVRMGADIKIDSRSAIIEGVPRLTGTQVRATDLRAGAAMVLAALTANGSTEVSDIHHIDRGYPDFDEKLRQLGANIVRI